MRLYWQFKAFCVGCDDVINKMWCEQFNTFSPLTATNYHQSENHVREKMWRYPSNDCNHTQPDIFRKTIAISHETSELIFLGILEAVKHILVFWTSERSSNCSRILFVWLGWKLGWLHVWLGSLGLFCSLPWPKSANSALVWAAREGKTGFFCDIGIVVNRKKSCPLSQKSKSLLISTRGRYVRALVSVIHFSICIDVW